MATKAELVNALYGIGESFVGSMQLRYYRLAIEQSVSIPSAWSTFMASFNGEIQAQYDAIMNETIYEEGQIQFTSAKPEDPADSLIPLVDLSA